MKLSRASATASMANGPVPSFMMCLGHFSKEAHMLVRSTPVGHCGNTICISEQLSSLQLAYLELGVHVCTGGQKHFGDIYAIASVISA